MRLFSVPLKLQVNIILRECAITKAEGSNEFIRSHCFELIIYGLAIIYLFWAYVFRVLSM